MNNEQDKEISKELLAVITEETVSSSGPVQGQTEAEFERIVTASLKDTIVSQGETLMGEHEPDPLTETDTVGKEIIFDLTETSSTQRQKQVSPKKGVIENNFFIKAGTVTIDFTKTTARITKRTVVKTFGIGVENFDSFMETLSYAMACLAYEMWINGNVKFASLFAIMSLFTWFAKKRVPKGSWSKFLELPTPEIKKVVAKTVYDLRQTFKSGK